MSGSTLFNAPWDHKLTMLTLLLSAILLGAGGFVAWLAVTRTPASPLRILLCLSAAGPLVAFLLAALLGPRGYAIESGRLRIVRFLSPIDIPLASIRAVERLPAERLAGSLRTLGSGGLFGYYGSFRNDDLGAYRMYATRDDGYVLVRAAQPFVLTPESPDLFIAALERERRPARDDRSQSER